MIKRDYFLSGSVRKLDNSSFRPAYGHITYKSWTPNTPMVLKEFLRRANVSEDEALEVYSFTQLNRYI